MSTENVFQFRYMFVPMRKKTYHKEWEGKVDVYFNQRIIHTTEMRFILCTWLGEISSCSCLAVLPGPAWVLLNKICKE